MIGIVDDVLGDAPIVFVQPVANVSTATILQRCETDLAHYRVPTEIHLMKELLPGPTGKILRRELRSPAGAAV